MRVLLFSSHVFQVLINIGERDLGFVHELRELAAHEIAQLGCDLPRLSRFDLQSVDKVDDSFVEAVKETLGTQ